MNKIRRDSEDIKKNQVEPLEMNFSDLEKEKISQLEDVPIQTIQSVTERETNGKE